MLYRRYVFYVFWKMPQHSDNNYLKINRYLRYPLLIFSVGSHEYRELKLGSEKSSSINRCFDGTTFLFTFEYI